MRLVVSGYYGFGNGGDEAVLAAIVAAFRRRDPGLELVVISGDPADTAARHGVQAVGRGPLGTIRAVWRSDGLVSGGGGLMQDRTSTASLLYYAGLMLLSALLRRPVFVYAQGVGPLRGRLSRWVAAQALRRAAYVSVRDQMSLEEVRALGVDRVVEVVPDPAITLSRPTIASSHEAEPPRLVIALRPWPGWDEFEPPFIEALAQLRETHRLTFLAMQPPTDGELASRLVAQLGFGSELVQWSDLAQLMSHIASARLVLGMRLHALILAAAAGVPFVAISYDPKVEAFANSLGQPVAGSVDGAVIPGDLVALVRAHAQTDRTAYRRAVAHLATRAERPADAIIAALRTGSA